MRCALYRRLAGAAGARDQLAHWKIVGENWEQLDQFAPELQTVRPDQVQFVMREYVRNIHYAVVGNRARCRGSCSPAASHQG